MRSDANPRGRRARSASRNDATPCGASRQRAGTLTLIARAAAHDRISAALRSARARAGLERAGGHRPAARRAASSISVATLERWERTGGIRLEEAVDLAAVYHM